MKTSLRKMSMFVMIACCGVVLLSSMLSAKPEPLLCYVGGTMRPVMEELVKIYEQKTGQAVQIDSADSGELLIKMQQTQKGDLYVAHDPFLGAVMNKGVGTQGWIVAALKPVIVVQKGNPKHITGFNDLAQDGIKLILTDAMYSTMGHIVDRIARKHGVFEKMEANVVSRPRGGSAAANAVMLGTADASIVWNAVAFLRTDKLDVVPIEAEVELQEGVDAITTATFGTIDMGRVKVTIATLKYSVQSDAAQAFAEFVASEEATQIWEKSGFLPRRTDEAHAITAVK